ncbi:hypothetical protein LSTR_LSTR015959 [Laodelphax striatellus]|uniref:Uncharacterized protein n=1 Tax=Laodelphax striatellus TaxID=195883 RepID=A0A482WH02_LAOST|nr:hypothetical protein LSTR_LSTR015959 [Laodelphax striatellus]
MARLLVVSATYKDYGRTEEIHQFLKRSNDCFSLLNLKNDALRKRGDALKYDLKKAEEVVSDLKARGHLTSTENKS